MAHGIDPRRPCCLSLYHSPMLKYRYAYSYIATVAICYFPSAREAVARGADLNGRADNPL